MTLHWELAFEYLSIPNAQDKMSSGLCYALMSHNLERFIPCGVPNWSEGFKSIGGG